MMQTNITLFENTHNTVITIIWAICAGFILACIALVYAKRTPGKIMRSLEQAGAFSPDTAKTIAELGMPMTWRIKTALAHGTVPRKYIVAVDEEKALIPNQMEGKAIKILRKIFSVEQKDHFEYDFSTQKWYLHDETRFEASIRYDPRGCNIPMVVITSVILCVIALVLTWIVPDMVDNFIQGLGL